MVAPTVPSRMEKFDGAGRLRGSMQRIWSALKQLHSRHASHKFSSSLVPPAALGRMCSISSGAKTRCCGLTDTRNDRRLIDELGCTLPRRRTGSRLRRSLQSATYCFRQSGRFPNEPFLIGLHECRQFAAVPTHRGVSHVAATKVQPAARPERRAKWPAMLSALLHLARNRRQAACYLRAATRIQSRPLGKRVATGPTAEPRFPPADKSVGQTDGNMTNLTRPGKI